MQIGILLFNEVEELDFVGPLEVLGIASKLKGGLQIVTVSKDGKQIQGRYGLKVQPDCSFANCPQFDLLIIPREGRSRTSPLRPREHRVCEGSRFTSQDCQCMHWGTGTCRSRNSRWEKSNDPLGRSAAIARVPESASCGRSKICT